jgi:hypothetical protein
MYTGTGVDDSDETRERGDWGGFGGVFGKLSGKEMLGYIKQFFYLQYILYLYLIEHLSLIYLLLNKST